MSDAGAEVSGTLDEIAKILETLIPVAITVIAIVGGVPVPIVAGLKVAQAVLPVAEKFFVTVGTKNFTLDVSATDPMKALRAAEAEEFPKLDFMRGKG